MDVFVTLNALLQEAIEADRLVVHIRETMQEHIRTLRGLSYLERTDLDANMNKYLPQDWIGFILDQMRQVNSIGAFEERTTHTEAF